MMSAGHPGFIRRGSVEPMHRVPERREWGLLARVIPDACRDSSSVAGDARHLGQSTHRVLHEMDDELGERCIELAVCERQLLRSSDLHLNSWMPLSGSDGELLRRVNRSYRRRPEAYHQFGCQRARPAADVEYALAG